MGKFKSIGILFAGFVLVHALGFDGVSKLFDFCVNLGAGVFVCFAVWLWSRRRTCAALEKEDRGQ